MKAKETKKGVQRKKGWEIYKASKRVWDDDVKGIDVGGKQVKFGPNRSFFTRDPTLADEINKTVGNEGSRDVVVCEVDNPGPHWPRRVFQIPELPWKK